MSSNSSVCEAIKREISIVGYAKMVGLELKPFGGRGQYNTVQHDSLIITPGGGRGGEDIFHWKSRDIGGSIIDFGMAYHGISNGEAIKMFRGLLNGNHNLRPAAANALGAPVPASVPKSFALPTQSNTGYKRMFAYLTQTRGLDKQVVSAMLNAKIIMEDTKGNVCFLGKDYDGAYKYGAKRGTNSDVVFRGDIAGSQKKIGFTYNVVGCTPKSLFVVEAPIDAMSIMSLLKHYGKDYNQYGYLSLGGCSDVALEYHVKHQPQLKNIYLSQDNDAAGDESRKLCKEKLAELGFSGQAIDKPPPPAFKDYGDFCQNTILNPITIERGLQP